MVDFAGGGADATVLHRRCGVTVHALGLACRVPTSVPGESRGWVSCGSTAVMEAALTVADITRWWGHVDRAAGEPSPHYERHWCHYQQLPVSSIHHGLVPHEAAACMQDMAETLGLHGEVQSTDELLRNLYYGHVCFAKERGFTPEKALLLFQLLRAHHEASMAGMGAEESRGALHSALLAASAQDVPEGGARLALEDVKALIGYYQPLYFDHYALLQAVFAPGEGAAQRETAVRHVLTRIERPPPTKRITPDGVETAEPTALLPPLATAMLEADWLREKRRKEQAVLDAEKARKEEEKRRKAEAEQRRLLGTPDEPEPEPEPEPEGEPEGEPEPIPEMLDRLVQEHFRPIKKHAEDTLRPRMAKLQAYFDELLVKAAAAGLSVEEEDA